MILKLLWTKTPEGMFDKTFYCGFIILRVIFHERSKHSHFFQQTFTFRLVSFFVVESLY